MDLIITLTFIIIIFPHYVCTSNNYVIYFKNIQLYLSIITHKVIFKKLKEDGEMWKGHRSQPIKASNNQS